MQCNRIFKGHTQSKARIDFFHFWRCYRRETRGLEGLKALSELNLCSENKSSTSAVLRHALPFCPHAFQNVVQASNGLREWPAILQSWVSVHMKPKAFWEHPFFFEMWICPRVLGHKSVPVQQLLCFSSCSLPMVMLFWIFTQTKASCLYSLCRW